MVYDRIIEMICQQFGMEPSKLNESTSFDDMDFDSIDVVELMADIEDEFGLDEISEVELMEMHTIGDLVAYVSARVDG